MDETTQLLMTFIIDKLATVAAIVEETIKKYMPPAEQAVKSVELIKYR